MCVSLVGSGAPVAIVSELSRPEGRDHPVPRHPLTRSGGVVRPGMLAAIQWATMHPFPQRKNLRPLPTTIRAMPCNTARNLLHEHAVYFPDLPAVRNL